MKLAYFDLRLELDRMVQLHALIRISNQESLCHKRCTFIYNLGFLQIMK